MSQLSSCMNGEAIAIVSIKIRTSLRSLCRIDPLNRNGGILHSKVLSAQRNFS
jgi:hypothetical protein